MNIEDLRIGMQVSIYNEEFEWRGETGRVVLIQGETKNRRANIGLDIGDGCVTDDFRPEDLQPVVEETEEQKLIDLAAQLPYELEKIKRIYQTNNSVERTNKFCRTIIKMGYDPVNFMEMLIK
jgi:hypothetical protein